MTVSDAVWAKANGAVGQKQVQKADTEGGVVWGRVLSSDGVTLYTPWLSDDGTWFCGCQGSLGGNVCYHVVAMLETMGLRALISFVCRRKDSEQGDASNGI